MSERSPDTVTCPMRRFRGATVAEIAAQEPDYLEWALGATGWGQKNSDVIENALGLDNLESARPSEIDDSEVTPHEQAVAAAKLTTCSMKKFRGYTIFEIAEEEPGYLQWAHRNTDWGSKNVALIDAALLQVNLNKIAHVPAPSLTEHQQQVVDRLTLGYELGYRVLKLMGGAGYGKSFATAALARSFIEKGFHVHACAVSYVATEVLREQLEPLGVSCATVAKTFRFNKKWIDGKETYEHSELTAKAAEDVLTGRNVLIVDECSMINDRDANLLFSTVLGVDRINSGVLILVGDQYQLPPVKQDTPSLCCTYNDPNDVILGELTQPMRYANDSHLYAVEQMARTDPWRLQHGHAPAGRVSRQVTEVDDIEEMIEEYVRNFEYDPAAKHRALLFRRRDVIDANNRIRYRIFGEDAQVVEEAEQLMVLSTTDHPYREPDPKTKMTDNTRYYSGTSFRVDAVEEGLYTIGIGGQDFEIPHYRVQFTGSPAWVSIIFGISEAQADHTKTGGSEYEAAVRAALEYGRALDEEGNRLGDWTPLKKLKSDFVLVAYTYASSVHRCQGQTLDYCYTTPRALLGVRPPMGPALVYVACTRAKKHLTLVR